MMRRLFAKMFAGFSLAAAIIIIGLSWLGQVPAVATVAEAPRLVPAILNGSPVSVLYITRSSDTVITRCYPGFEPSLTVQAMGNNAGQMEGVLTCVSSQ